MGATIATVIGVAASLAATGYAMSGAGNPTYPNTAAGAAQLAAAQAEMLPIQRALSAAAQQGTAVTVNMPAHKTTTQAAYVPGPTVQGRYGPVQQEGTWVPYVESEWQDGGKYAQYGTPKIKTRTINVPGGPQKFDFSGYGEAEVKGKLAEAMAKVQLALSQKYDSQFIDQALEQEKLADPESFAARQKMNDLVQEQINRPLNEPVADELSRQVQSEMDAAGQGKLDTKMHDVLMDAGSDAFAARGGASATNQADLEQPLTTGSAGTRRTMGAIQKGVAELTGGQTPEDIQYRREQQNLANLSNFISGRTPQSEFKSLSGAQQGPTPFAPGSPLPTAPNATQAGQNAAIDSWQTKLGLDASQANPWMAGISALLGVGNAAAGLGWRPLSNGANTTA